MTAVDEAVREVDEPVSQSEEPIRQTPRQLVTAVRELCPYLEAEAGWRSTSAQRDLRCQAVNPAVRIALDKQRRLCVRSAHHECPTYLAARAARPTLRTLGAGSDVEVETTTTPDLWQFARTAPVAIDDGRIGLPIPIAGRERTVPQTGLAAVMVAVLAILVGVRLAGGDSGSVRSGQPSAGASQVVGVAATPSATPTPTAPPSATPEAPSPSPTDRPSASPTGAVAGATATASARTYRVRSGDTLYAIAQRFGTTAKAIQELNEIDDPSRLRVGQVLRIP